MRIGRFSQMFLLLVVSGWGTVWAAPEKSVDASILQQSAKITTQGTVIDAQGEPLIGVSILEVGTTNGTITDIDGKFTLQVTSGATLELSYIGYKTQQLKAVSDLGTIQMSDDTEVLQEVVVTALGIKREKKALGYAMQEVKGESLVEARETNLANALSGKISGVQIIRSSNGPGGSSKIQLRGANSVTGTNQPLIVVDGVPMDNFTGASNNDIDNPSMDMGNGLSDINPEDIESMSVLKGASAAALYGSRAGNGVILITTKKGKQGKAKVNVSANFTIAEPSKLLEMTNLYEHAAYINSRVSNGQYPFYVVGDEVRYVFNDALANYDPNNPATYHIINYRNWQKEIYTSAFSQNYSLSVSGGTDKTTYYISANFKDINGTVKQTGLKQGDLRANIGMDLSKSVHLNMTLSGSLRQNNMMAGGSTLGGSTTAISRTALDYAPFEMPDGDPSFSSENKTTIFSWLNDYEDIANDKTFNASMDLSWNIMKGLRYNLRVGGNLNINDRKRWYGLQLYQGMNNNGYLALTDLNKSNVSIENVLNYNTKLGSVATLDATVGVTYDDYNFLNENTNGSQFTMFDLRENGLHMAGNVQHLAPIQKDYQLLSYLGRINLTFLDKYLITASLRADGSSKFGKGNRWGYFPSASVAWRMEQEEFLKEVDWLNQLKVRVSYGVTGNQSIDPYSTFSMYGSDGNYHYGNGNGEQESVLQITNLPNDGLTWEKTASWNAGLDFSLLRSRLSGTFDFYVKRTNDLLISRSLPGSAGFGSTYYNQGSLDNKGVEFSLTAQVIDTKDWKWSITGNIGKNKSKIVNLGLLPTDFGCLGERIGYYGNSLGDHFGVGHVFLQGEAPGLFLGYVTQGIVQPEDITDQGVKFIKDDGTIGYYKDVNGSIPAAGDIKFVDKDGNGSVNTSDRDIIGNPNPGFTYGFQTSLSWKGLTLSAAFNGVQDRDVINVNNRYINTPGQKAGTVSKKAFEGMWTPENHSNLYPSSNFIVQNMVMDRYVEDASYLRCSDITLNYALPTAWMKKIGFQNTSIFASVKNAFVITDYSGYDPEVNSFAFDGLRPGVDMSSYPTPRQFVFGLNVTF